MGWVENLYLLPEPDSQMFTQTLDTSATQHRSTGRHSAQRFEPPLSCDSQIPTHELLELATALLIHYSFDLSGHSATELVSRWQTQYPVNWLHLAVIEALYQGRYKAFSVQQILTFWQRRGQAIFHFNMEFERLICSKFPESLTSLTSPFLSPAKEKTTELLPRANSLTDKSATAASVGHGYRRNKMPIQVMSEEKPVLQKQARESTQTEKVLLSSTTYSPGRQAAYALSSKATASGHLLTQTSTSLNKEADLSPPAVNHPPIGQFTPEKSDRSELFTSKLKAMSSEKLLRRYAQEETQG
jgi:hypothetical protein